MISLFQGEKTSDFQYVLVHGFLGETFLAPLQTSQSAEVETLQHRLEEEATDQTGKVQNVRNGCGKQNHMG